ncbi:MAG: ComF family protein [Phycisphaerales bacterium JB060]
MRGGLFQLVRTGLISIERSMLSDTPGPLEALRQSGFVADDPDAYCPRCGRSVGPGEFSHGDCGSCRNVKKVAWDGFVRLGVYELALREALHDFKFDRWHAVGEHLGVALGAAVAERLRLVARHAGEPEEAVLGRTLVSPVPMSFWRRASRGIDHATCLARAVGKGSGVPCRRLLVRQHRPTQTGLSAAARKRNLHGAMRPIVDREALRGVRVIVLVDDVTTTGATLVEACRAIRALSGSRGEPVILAACIAVAEPARKGGGIGSGLPLVETAGAVSRGGMGGGSKKTAVLGASKLDAD